MTLHFKLLFILIFMISCQSDRPLPNEKPKKNPDSDDLIIGDGSELPTLLWANQAWTKHIVNKLQTKQVHLLPLKDMDLYCSSYEKKSDQEKLYVWAYLMSVMAKKESSFDPDTSYTESFTDSTGARVVSRGLFQLSYESANQKAYDCNFSSHQEIHDPQKNIDCAVNILSYWAKKDQYVGSLVDGKPIGGARYWAVLRRNSSNDFVREETERFCKD